MKPRTIPVTDEIWLAASMVNVPVAEAIHVAKALKES
jgi:hypothetical protein